MEAPIVVFVLVCMPLIILCVPIAIVAATILAYRISGRWFELQERRLDLAKWEAERRYDVLRLQSTLPPWLDAADPLDVAAWRAANAETSRLLS